MTTSTTSGHYSCPAGLGGRAAVLPWRYDTRYDRPAARPPGQLPGLDCRSPESRPPEASCRPPGRQSAHSSHSCRTEASWSLLRPPVGLMTSSSTSARPTPASAAVRPPVGQSARCGSFEASRRGQLPAGRHRAPIGRPPARPTTPDPSVRSVSSGAARPDGHSMIVRCGRRRRDVVSWTVRSCPLGPDPIVRTLWSSSRGPDRNVMTPGSRPGGRDGRARTPQSGSAERAGVKNTIRARVQKILRLSPDVFRIRPGRWPGRSSGIPASPLQPWRSSPEFLPWRTATGRAAPCDSKATSDRQRPRATPFNACSVCTGVVESQQTPDEETLR